MDLLKYWEPLLRHPLVTLLVGAVLTGLVVPRITRQWQLRQKRLEVKTALVAELSELVMRFVMAVQFVHVGAASFSQESFDEAYREWEVGSAVFGTKLQAYLPMAELPAEWSRFSESVTHFYALEGTPPDQRPASVERLASRLQPYLDAESGDEWMRHRGAILKWKSAIIQNLMASEIQLEA
jgi:hypothetical protein